MRKVFLSGILLLLTGALAAQAPAQLQTFHATTRLVEIPVEALNAQGQFIAGLHRRDFVVKINGHDVPIVNLDHIRGQAYRTVKQMQSSASAPAAPPTISNQPSLHPVNRIIFLFDLVHLTPMVRAQLQLRIHRILQRPIPGNEDIAVLEENPGLIELQPFTQNRALLWDAVRSLENNNSHTNLVSIYRSIGGIYGSYGGSAEPLANPPLAGC